MCSGTFCSGEEGSLIPPGASISSYGLNLESKRDKNICPFPYYPDGPIRYCKDFVSQSEAQEFYDEANKKGIFKHNTNLDPDSNKLACERL